MWQAQGVRGRCCCRRGCGWRTEAACRRGPRSQGQRLHPCHLPLALCPLACSLGTRLQNACTPNFSASFPVAKALNLSLNLSLNQRISDRQLKRQQGMYAQAQHDALHASTDRRRHLNLLLFDQVRSGGAVRGVDPFAAAGASKVPAHAHLHTCTHPHASAHASVRTHAQHARTSPHALAGQHRCHLWAARARARAASDRAHHWQCVLSHCN